MRKDLAVIGLQTGDEGKGKIQHALVREAVKNSGSTREGTMPVFTMRYQGGANAGHTVVMDGTKYKLHQVPSGILVPRTYNLVGDGCFVNPRELMNEIRTLRSQGVQIASNNLGIASNAHVTLDYHIKLDENDSNNKNSTGRGIKPTAVDKMARVGARFQEFLDADAFQEALSKRFPKGMPKRFQLGSINKLVDSYAPEREFLADYSTLQTDAMNMHGTDFRIAEGAQGFKLDVDKGLYPGVTSSNPATIPFRKATVLGVVKLYESSVGNDRPFVGQIKDKVLESHLRTKFGEFGTTTGRPRDLGWLDIVALRHAIETTDTDYLVGTCGDKLEYLHDLQEPIKLVVGYRINGKVYDRWDKSFHDRRVLYEAKPVFEELPEWRKFTETGKLTDPAQRYIDRIQNLVKKEFVMLGTGEDENALLTLKNLLLL